MDTPENLREKRIADFEALIGGNKHEKKPWTRKYDGVLLPEPEGYYDSPGDCWVFYPTQGHGSFKGAPRSMYGGEKIAVYAYRLYYGPIPEGFRVGHTCRWKFCCNPEHLILVPPTEKQKEWDAKLRDGYLA